MQNIAAQNQAVNPDQEIASFSWSQIAICLLLLVGTLRVVKLLRTILGSFFRRRLDLKGRYEGGWALVTGGSEGIGEAIARELAKSGFNLILVSRSCSKLQKAKQAILKLYPAVSVEVHAIDLALLQNEQQYRQAFGSIFERDISILVNNVGYYAPDCFIDIPFSTIRTEAKLNLIPIAALTTLFLEKTQKRAGRSGLINLSSGAGMIVYKGTAHYSATKTFDDIFSQSLANELPPKTDVLTVRPFYVSTPMTKNLWSFGYATPEQTGKEAVNSLGNTDICYGPLLHRINGAMIEFAGEALTTWSSSRSIGDFKQQYHKAD